MIDMSNLYDITFAPEPDNLEDYIVSLDLVGTPMTATRLEQANALINSWLWRHITILPCGCPLNGVWLKDLGQGRLEINENADTHTSKCQRLALNTPELREMARKLADLPPEEKP